MIKAVIFSVCIVGISQFSFTQEKLHRWNKYVQPLIDSIKGSETKKIFFANFNLIGIDNGNLFDSVIESKYNLSKKEWANLWNIWRINYSKLEGWHKTISTEKKIKLTKTNRWKDKKIKILSVSPLIFIEKNLYIIAITTHCRGLCSVTDMLFVRYDENRGICIIENRINGIFVS